MMETFRAQLARARKAVVAGVGIFAGEMAMLVPLLLTVPESREAIPAAVGAALSVAVVGAWAVYRTGNRLSTEELREQLAEAFHREQQRARR